MDIEILGGGKQRGSYLDVIDGPDGIFYGVANVMNVTSSSALAVTSL
jgi:hypothetical protein